MFPKIISFDLDGTLTTPKFVDSVWRVGVPQLHAEKHGISFEEAQHSIFHKYNEMGDDDLKWYDLPFWIEYLNLEVSPHQLLSQYQHLIALFPDVLPALSFFQECYDLIIISNANRMFLDLEVSVTGIGRFFKKIFSATSDFGRVKREEEIYQKVCDVMGVAPSDIIHVGDHREFDFESPQRIGMHTYFLDRSKNQTSPQVIHGLEDFIKTISIESLQEFFL
jgi:HAD superfamily hydrolase (TIGR01549 family)